MKQAIFAGALALFAGVATPAFAATWDLDPMHTDVGFSVRHMMVSNVRGSFKGVKGSLDWDEKDVTKSKVEVTIDTASVDTRQEKRDEDLRSATFFDATKFPNITFKSTKVKKSGKKFELTGDLTIRDVTKSVKLTAEGLAPGIKDPFGKTRTGVSATGKISRKDFGLTWSKALETGGAVVGDEVAIEINAEFTKAGDAPAAGAPAPAAPAPAPAPAANPPPKT